MRDNLSELEFNLLMLVAPVLRKLAYADGKVGTLADDEPLTRRAGVDRARSRSGDRRRAGRHAATTSSRSGSPTR